MSAPAAARRARWRPPAATPATPVTAARNGHIADERQGMEARIGEIDTEGQELRERLDALPAERSNPEGGLQRLAGVEQNIDQAPAS